MAPLGLSLSLDSIRQATPAVASPQVQARFLREMYQPLIPLQRLFTLIDKAPLFDNAVSLMKRSVITEEEWADQLHGRSYNESRTYEIKEIIALIRSVTDHKLFSEELSIGGMAGSRSVVGTMAKEGFESLADQGKRVLRKYYQNQKVTSAEHYLFFLNILVDLKAQFNAVLGMVYNANDLDAMDSPPSSEVNPDQILETIDRLTEQMRSNTPRSEVEIDEGNDAEERCFVLMSGSKRSFERIRATLSQKLHLCGAALSQLPLDSDEKQLAEKALIALHENWCEGRNEFSALLMRFEPLKKSSIPIEHEMAKLQVIIRLSKKYLSKEAPPSEVVSLNSLKIKVDAIRSNVAPHQDALKNINQIEETPRYLFYQYVQMVIIGRRYIEFLDNVVLKSEAVRKVPRSPRNKSPGRSPRLSARSRRLSLASPRSHSEKLFRDLKQKP